MVGCASVLTLTVFPASADQATTAAKPDKTYAGTVVSVNPNGHTIEVKGFLLSKKFNLGENCAYKPWDQTAGPLSDLRAGEKVVIGYQDASGVLVADRIKQEPMTDQGMVKAIDPAAHTLTLNTGWTDETFRIPDDCAVVLHGNKSGSLADVQPGYYVMVTYELPQDKPVARQIAQTGTTFTGELTAVDLGNRMVKAKSLFDSKRFVLADNCAIVVNGKLDRQLSDLKLGDETSFSYEDVGGVNVVNRIANEPTPRQTEITSAQPMVP
jgi:hypothetical protein